MEEPKSGLDTLALARLAAYGRPVSQSSRRLDFVLLWLLTMWTFSQDWGTLEPDTLLNTAVYKLLNGYAEQVVQIARPGIRSARAAAIVWVTSRRCDQRSHDTLRPRAYEHAQRLAVRK